MPSIPSARHRLPRGPAIESCADSIPSMRRPLAAGPPIAVAGRCENEATGYRPVMPENRTAADRLVQLAIELSDQIPLAAGVELTEPARVGNHLLDVIELLGPHELPAALHFALDDYISARWEM
jgi:hypothetical protein